MAALTLTLARTAHRAPAGAVTPYSVAGGCYALQNADTGRTVPGAERVRLKATTLGSYLLYRPDRTFLAASERRRGGARPRAQPGRGLARGGHRPSRGVRALARVTEPAACC